MLCRDKWRGGGMGEDLSKGFRIQLKESEQGNIL